MSAIPYGFLPSKALGMVPMAPDVLDAAQMLRPPSSWERRMRHLDRLLDAGIPHDEATEIINDLYSAEVIKLERKQQ